MRESAKTAELEVEIEMNYVPVKPLADRVILCVVPVDMKTKSGIIIPDTAAEKSLKGVVVAIGEQSKVGQHVKQTELKMGDLVLFNKFAGTPIEVADDPEGEYSIMREADILVILAHKGQSDCSDREPEQELAEINNDAK